MSQLSPSPPKVSQPAEMNVVQKYAPWLYSFWKFTRPHTIIGTSLSAIGLFAIAWAFSGDSLTGKALLPLFGTWFTCLCGNVYIVGLNQLFDIEIDQINKPELPVAAGEFTQRQGQIIVGITGILAVALAALQGPWLLATVLISLGLGTVYSLPPIRLKRFPFWASFCIFTVRGIIVNLGLFLHYQWVMPGSGGVMIPPSVWALTLFVLGFTFAIAIFKDIPDMEGDRLYQISTLTLRLGARTVFDLARWVIVFCYIATSVAAFLWLPQVNPFVLAIAHGVALTGLWWRSRLVDLEDKVAIAACYQFIWKLFFLEYIMFPVACLLA
ncbi:homogentisate phytyltransferase [Oscillatoria acuminata]|uniref:4-hydroxybenzoate polyprenyltransferase-like prenyltransferase n=1 Tax=Oscillatoria acuminata PCC 6304 TaxID=56110 RepID=K9TK50_9CYAN|nr:homogentisate phytyltransferase [Oscillatoria acuminata]AFY83242.1 4-hydroxybenzoate polyprenyltransferase-like prenyltransferase [Oscillatoria acuminata PCC 6304]